MLEIEARVGRHQRVEGPAHALDAALETVLRVGVLERLSNMDVQLASFEPKKTIAQGPFKIVTMDLLVRGLYYPEFIKFLDSLEHGDRVIRIEKIRVERLQRELSMSCTIRGLVKGSAKKPTKAEIAASKKAEVAAAKQAAAYRKLHGSGPDARRGGAPGADGGDGTGKRGR